MSNFSLNKSKNSKGFTIIELLVVFTVIVIISGVGFASFMSYSRQQGVDQSAANLKQTIEKAKFNALSKVKPLQNCDALVSYRVEFGAGCRYQNRDYDYCIKSSCSNSGIMVRNIIYTAKLSTNIHFNPSPSCSTIDFGVLRNNVLCNGNPIPMGAKKNIILTGYGNNKTVSIDQVGNITLE